MYKREPKYPVGTRVRVINERHRNDEVGYVSKVKSRKVLNDVTGYTYHIQFKGGSVSSFSEASIREEPYTTRLKKIETAEFSPETIKSMGAISTVFTEAGSSVYKVCKEAAQLFQIRETIREDVTNEYFIDWFFKLENWVNVGPEQFPFDLLIHSDEVPVYGCFYGGKLDAIIRIDEYRADCEISFFAVNPSIQNRGIGQHLFQYVLKRYSDRPLTLHVYTDNSTAIHIYEKYGFKIIAGGYGEGPYPTKPSYTMRRDAR